MFVLFHVYLPASEGDSFCLQPEALFESIVSPQLYSASRAQHALPGKATAPRRAATTWRAPPGNPAAFATAP